jgi:hypothetical protein
MVDLQGKTPDQAYTALAHEIAEQMRKDPKSSNELRYWQNTTKELLKVMYRMGYTIDMIITAINTPEQLMRRQPPQQPNKGSGIIKDGDIKSAMKEAKLKSIKK